MIALVTGGSGGIGSAVCEALASGSYMVAIGCLRREREAAVLAERLCKEGHRAFASPFDVSNPEAVERAIDAIAREHGGLDALVSAAAWNADGLLADIAPQDVDRMYAVNVHGTMNCIRAALPWLMGSSRGRIVNFSSIIAARSVPGISGYASTKGAIESLTRALAVELGSRGITVNAVAPGFINDGLGRRIVDAAGDMVVRNSVPLRRVGTAAEVAAVVRFLVSEEAGYVTGVVIPVDGGVLAGSRGVREFSSIRSGEVS